MKAYTINAFAKTEEGGNPAGVVLHADELSVNNMKKIAATLRFSETAFVMKSNIADFEVRFFTPLSEVDLCGHATIGTFSVLQQEKVIKPGFYSQQTRAGLLNVEARADRTIMMNQTTPTFSETIRKAEIADSLNITEDAFIGDLPVRIVSTGLRDIIVPIRTMDRQNAIRPDFRKVKEVSKKYHAAGYHLFSLETLYGSYACCRNLAPIVGIPEESATGTASGALACYLYEYGIFTAEECGHLVFEQGYSMNRPSEILASLRVEEKKITEVRIGGIALNQKSIEIEI